MSGIRPSTSDWIVPTTDEFMYLYSWTVRPIINDSILFKGEFSEVLEIKLALPGVKKEDLELTCTKNNLEIKYEGESTFVDKFERNYNTEGYNASKAKVSLVDGVLEVVMDKKEAYKPKKLKF